MSADINPERACDLCRERRVKCDKRKPGCARCEKLGRPCPGYAKKRKFVDEGVTLRRKFEHANFPETDVDSASQRTVSGPSKTAIKDVDNRTSPKEEGWRNVLPRSHDEPISAAAYGSYGLPQGAIIPTVAAVFSESIAEPDRNSNDDLDGAIFDPEWFDLDPEAYYDQAGNSCGFLRDAPTIVDEVDRGEDLLTIGAIEKDDLAMHNDFGLWAGQSQLNTSQLISDQREHEMAYLTRHFCENIGPWMDLFDGERHFAQLVPLKALRDILLKNAIAAVAAKQLGCTKGGKPYTMPQNQPPATMETINSGVEWFYKAANYYDKAIMYSRVYLQALSGSLSAPPSPSISASLTAADSDDLLLAVSIFSLYEYLDNADLGWVQHLTGLRTILSVLDVPVPRSLDLDSIALGRRASFWNFARADYQAAYINKTFTLLDTEDIEMWTSSGLQLQAGGGLYANPQALALDQGAQSVTIELAARTLLWLLLRTMNYIAKVDTDSAQKQSDWEALSSMLDSWQAACPKSFRPCARLPHPSSRSSSISELFFSIPLCAATVQLYHFARLLLLLHRPTALASHLQVQGGKADKQSELLAHAYTIISIALGRPCLAVRVEMLLPLHVAGSCLQADDERRIVVDLLLAIQKDTGCEASGRVKDLTKTWGWASKHTPKT